MIDCKPALWPTTCVSVDQLRRWTHDRHLLERFLGKPLTNVVFELTEDKKNERLVLCFGPERVVIESRHARGAESWITVDRG